MHHRTTNSTRFLSSAAVALFIAFAACVAGPLGCTIDTGDVTCETEGNRCVCDAFGDPRVATCVQSSDSVICTCTNGDTTVGTCEEPLTNTKCEDRDPAKTSCCLQFFYAP